MTSLYYAVAPSHGSAPCWGLVYALWAVRKSSGPARTSALYDPCPRPGLNSPGRRAFRVRLASAFDGGHGSHAAGPGRDALIGLAEHAI